MTRADRDVYLVILMSKVADIMAEQAISQAELARRMNASPAAVSKMLSLKVDPRASSLVAMLSALNCTLDMKPAA